MAKCIKCGRKGLFFKVNENKLCSNCVILSDLEEKLADQQKLYDSIVASATEEGTKQANLKLELISHKYQKLEADLIETNEKLQKDIEQKNKDLSLLEYRIKSEQKTFDSLKERNKHIQYAIDNFFEADIFPENIRYPETSFTEDDLLSATVPIELHCYDVKQLKKLFNANKRKIKDVFKAYQSRYTTKANQSIYRLMVIALEAELQNVLYSIKFGSLETAVTSIKEITAKYLTIASDGNQSIVPTIAKFIGEIESLFLEAVNIEYEYFVQRERIKEEQRSLREQMRQEAAERKVLEKQKLHIEKEEGKYKTEISNIGQQIASCQDNEKIIQLQRRLDELQAQLEDVQNKKDEIIKRQNGQAGYVYIISNLGSFGENVFKVGMTRRLDPQDRIDELGNASVPFPFDVHSFIFSDNAVQLESDMHQKLNQQRVNKVNRRKEFFKVSIDELEELVYSLQPSAEFKRTMLAEQYNQSLSIDELSDFDDPNEDNDEELSECLEYIE